jgi:hypothetical protein
MRSNPVGMRRQEGDAQVPRLWLMPVLFVALGGRGQPSYDPRGVRFKRPAINIMQLPGDGPFRQSRVRYSRFCNPRAKSEAIVARVAGIHTAKGWPAFTAEAAV